MSKCMVCAVAMDKYIIACNESWIEYQTVKKAHKRGHKEAQGG